ncbi:MAG: hypothetical protein JL50_00435 [Peptococcaceae bacterium BICA1-7]|nr:MAG: hypothetical protein JL50_00435 [Peptococcaceae bacterium BICA1-7]HBV98146.1 peptidase A24 [Desulfotomaculum sp.]
MKALSNLGLNYSDYLLFLLLIICILTDIKSRRVYNNVLLPFLIISLAAGFIAGGWALFLEGVKGFILGLIVFIIPFSRGGIGAGDVKLMAVIGGIKGPVFVVKVFLAGALAGGLIALVFLAAGGQLQSTLSRLLQTFLSLLGRYGMRFQADSRENEAKPVYFPYTLAIGAGVIAVYTAGWNSF